jgi:hypothetical protein
LLSHVDVRGPRRAGVMVVEIGQGDVGQPDIFATVRSMTSSAPPPIDSNLLSRKYREIQVSSM